MTEQLERIDQLFLRLNLLVLFVVVFLPFPTRLVAAALYAGIAVYLVAPFREATRVLIPRHSTRQ